MIDNPSLSPGGAVTALAAAAAPGMTSLTERDLNDLRRATADLLRVGGASARSELAHFREVCGRGPAVDKAACVTHTLTAPFW